MTILRRSLELLVLLFLLAEVTSWRHGHKKHRNSTSTNATTPSTPRGNHNSTMPIRIDTNSSTHYHREHHRGHHRKTVNITKSWHGKKHSIRKIHRKEKVTSRRKNMFRGNTTECLEGSRCNCTSYGQLVTVNCYNLTSVQSLVEAVDSKLNENHTITHIYMRDSKFDRLPDDFLANRTIQQVLINRLEVREVSPFTFRGIDTLYHISIHSWNLDTLPSLFIPAGRLLVARLYRTNLTHFDTQLANMTSLQVVTLNYNKISQIDEDAFENLSALKTLDLSHNRLENISSRTFRHLVNIGELRLQGNRLTTVDDIFKPMAYTLNKLYLSYNRLESLDKVLVTRLGKLTLLDLSNNKLKELRLADFYNKLPQLRSLYLSNNSLSVIEPDVFRSIFQIEQIDFTNNSLSSIPPQVFANLERLVRLKFNGNKLANDHSFYVSAKGLQALHLNGNGISNIDYAFRDGYKNKTPEITTLSLNKNNITRIVNDTFIKSRLLRFLYLMYNQISYLEADAFKGLSSLIRLTLSQNKLTQLNGALLHLSKVTQIWLGENQLTTLTEKEFGNRLIIRELKLQGNRLRDVHGAFRQLKSLWKLNLSNNSITTLTEDSFPQKTHLFLLYMFHNPLECDCRIGWIQKLAHRRKLKIPKLTTCYGPARFKNVQLRWVKTRSVYEWPVKCPDNCSCFCQPNGTDYSIHVNCSGETHPNRRNHSVFPMTYPEKTVMVNLSQNSLTFVPSNISLILPTLRDLDLENNNISTLQSVQFPRTMLRLRLADNMMSTFDADVDNKSLALATLSGNPWRCDCSSTNFRTWLLENSRVVSDINETRCLSDDPQTMRFNNQIITSLKDNDLCPMPVALYIIIIIAILGGLLACTSFFITYIRYRMPIKVWLYSRGLSCIKEEDIDEDKLFDAFLAYSNEDHSLANDLAKRLEKQPQPNYRLCLHYRDFVPGNYILDNINWAVRSSKKTIVLLSSHFIKGTWTLEEFKTAYQQMMEEKVKRIILVRVGDLPPKEEIGADIKSYLATTTYLDSKDPYVWEKLIYEMPKTAMGPMKRCHQGELVTDKGDCDTDELLLNEFL